MNTASNCLRMLKWMSGIFLSLLLSGCAGLMDKEADSDVLSLHYQGVTQICPGTDFAVMPTYHGEKPSDFRITKVKHNGKTSAMECFSVDAETGEFRIMDSYNAPTGEYKVSISCMSVSGLCHFNDAVLIQMMKPVPEGIIVEPARLTVSLSDISSPDVKLPTAQVKTIGKDFVTIKKYIIANVYKNGQPLPEAKDWFEISETGEISIVQGNAAIESGVFALDLRLTTYVAGEDYEDGLFMKAVIFDICAPPSSLIYPSDRIRLEKGYAAKAPVPEFKGSLTDLRFSIKSVYPNNDIGITVDESTGIIRFPETDKTNVGDTYVVSISAENSYGSKDFDDVYTFEIIDFITPASLLVYDNIEEIITGLPINHLAKEIEGDELTFSFVDLDETLASGLRINSKTGEVICEKGVELPVGNHEIKVQASNIKASVTSSFIVNIVPNPYDFTYVRWGNNMGLSPHVDYGNQFRIYCGDPTLRVPVLESDIPTGVPVEYTFVQKSKIRSMQVSVNKTTGELTIYPITSENNTCTHYGMIEVKVGGDAPAAKTKSFPLFVDHQGYRSGYRIEYTPFVLRVNPQKGGTSSKPVISMKDGGTPYQFTLDNKRHVWYWNINGPTGWTDGRLSDYGAEHFMYGLWQRYYSTLGKLPNTVAVNPVSWYAGNNGQSGNIVNTGCYINPETLALTVNPNKFYDVNGAWADGVMSVTMVYNINGISPQSEGGVECWPLMVWFDTSYDK